MLKADRAEQPSPCCNGESLVYVSAGFMCVNTIRNIRNYFLRARLTRIRGIGMAGSSTRKPSRASRALRSQRPSNLTEPKLTAVAALRGQPQRSRQPPAPDR